MMLEDYIKMLHRKLDNYGNVKVGITERGYYSSDDFAELYEDAELQTLADGGKILVLGHSEQSP